MRKARWGHWILMGLGIAAGVAVPVNSWAQSEDELGAPSATEEPIEESGSGASVGPAEVALPESPAAGEEIAAGAVDDGAVAGLISVDFKDADIRQVLRIISLKSGVDIVAGADVEGLVTIKLTNVPWEQALDIILRTYGFTYERKGGIVRVMTVDALEQEALSTEVFPLDYATAKEVPDVIKEMLSERGRVKFDERTNTVIVTDIPTNLFQIKQVIARIDQRTPQVYVESKIVETKLENDENLGIDWFDSLALTQTASIYPSTFPFPSQSSLGEVGERYISTAARKIQGSTNLTTVNPMQVQVGLLTGPAMSFTLNMLKTRTDTKIVSNPSMLVLNNQTASILVGEEFPVPQFSVDPNTGNTTVSGFEPKELGTVLKVTPHVNPSKEIVMDLAPEVSSAATANATFSISGTSSVSLPRFTIQKVSTQVRVRDGQTIVIGGLVKTIKLVEDEKVPVLGDIPLVGLLFRNRHKFGGSTNPDLQQDLLVFVTVRLVEEPKVEAVASAGGEP